MKQSAPLQIDVLRGHDTATYVESVHGVDVVVVDAEGKVHSAMGDVDRYVFPRSAIKALQALCMVESGAPEAFGLQPHHLALACASHNGESFQTEAAKEMINLAGLSETCLECGAQIPHRSEDFEALIKSGQKVTALHNNCSGKHAGFLAFAAKTALPVKGYIHFDSPVQKEVAATLQAVTGAPHGESNYGRDGCSIPTYNIPLLSLAQAYARFAVGHDTLPVRAAAMQRLRDACMHHAEYVGGTNRFDTLLMQGMRGRVFTKIGAEGVFVAAIPEMALGFALKCRDGSAQAAEVACAYWVKRLLQQSSQGLEQAEIDLLDRLSHPLLKNWNAFIVGGLTVQAG